ncbi:conserved hypothetical protein [Trichinella spiralis]|uniref:hypothetical protein n=1 Tax=Trichinella spiralis TaxID=6334 RepID=UPI0001EFE6C0|nr:conserved hypothetical protein [Trichinella spiralis]
MHICMCSEGGTYLLGLWQLFYPFHRIPNFESFSFIEQQRRPIKDVEDAAMQIVSCQNATPVDYGNYLDLDMSLVEQPDELAVLKESISLNAIEQFKRTCQNIPRADSRFRVLFVTASSWWSSALC